MKKSVKFARCNAAAIALVLAFISVYIALHSWENAALYFGTTGMNNLHAEYYRWFTCLFLHRNLWHLLSNCAALLSVSTLLSSFLGNRKTGLIFLTGGVAAEMAYSVVVSDLVYDIGASSGIFALIACLIVCSLRFPERFRLTWRRPDALIVGGYFVLANSSVSAFLVHTFGFAAGILLGLVMVWTGQMSKD